MRVFHEDLPFWRVPLVIPELHRLYQETVSLIQSMSCDVTPLSNHGDSPHLLLPEPVQCLSDKCVANTLTLYSLVYADQADTPLSVYGVSMTRYVAHWDLF